MALLPDVFFLFLLAMRRGIEYCKLQDSMADQMENEQRAEIEAEMKIMHPNVKVRIELKLMKEIHILLVSRICGIGHTCSPLDQNF